MAGRDQALRSRPALNSTDWNRRAFWLVGGTAAYNSVEAVVALYAAWKARSVALLGFGLDSVIEIAAALFMLWRLRSERAEGSVRRAIGATFLLLAGYVSYQSIASLRGSRAPEESLLGIVLALASLILMPVIAYWKFRAAREIGSEALRAEAKETLACSYLSFTLLLGLVANAWRGWWQADPVAALLMVPWLVKEGMEGIRGEECGCERSNRQS